MSRFVSNYAKIVACVVCVMLLVFFAFPLHESVHATKEPIVINFAYNGQNWVYDTAKFESKNYPFTAIGQKNGRWGNGTARAEILGRVKKLGFGAKHSLEYCFVGMEKVLDKIQAAINRPSKDASYSFYPRKSNPFSFSPEQTGYLVDFDQILEAIRAKLPQENNITIDVEPIKLQPMVDMADIEHFGNLRGSFYTSFNGGIANRKNNIERAAASFNGLVMDVGAEFSFNKITGRRTEANGYLPANIIVNNKYKEGFGGGVCQVSTTLYNALLLAGMDILEVHSHSLASSYVNMGFDAMVNYGTADLKWVNNTDTRVFVQSAVKNNQIHFKIWGDRQPGSRQYKRITEVEKTIAPKPDEVIVDKAGQHANLVNYTDESAYLTAPKNGYRVRAILECYQGEKLVSRKLLRRVTYQAVQGVKVVGAKERPAEKIENAQNGSSLDKSSINFWRNFI